MQKKNACSKQGTDFVLLLYNNLIHYKENRTCHLQPTAMLNIVKHILCALKVFSVPNFTIGKYVRFRRIFTIYVAYK